jgi:flagellar motor switch protein FliG
MNDSTLPVFEDVVSLDDALVQNRLARAPDALIAAALDRAPIPVRLKIVQNLSARRRESVERISEVF